MDDPKAAAAAHKTSFADLPVEVLDELARVMTHGARKYGRLNWRRSHTQASTYFNATLRHLLTWWRGEGCDKESGLHHLVHAMASLVVLRDTMLRGGEFEDDRPIERTPMRGSTREEGMTQPRTPLPPYEFRTVSEAEYAAKLKEPNEILDELRFVPAEEGAHPVQHPVEQDHRDDSISALPRNRKVLFSGAEMVAERDRLRAMVAEMVGLLDKGRQYDDSGFWIHTATDIGTVNRWLAAAARVAKEAQANG